MKKDLHPEYNELTVTLADGSTFTTRSTMDRDAYESEVDSTNHPFYTGRRQFVDTAGRVEKFNRRYGIKSNNDDEEENAEAEAEEK
jgi:large subunit ribosomal protein L31